MGLYQKTTACRATVTQEIRVILPPETGAPIGSLRKVQIVVPTEPRLYIGIDKSPEELGLNRTYKLPHVAPGQLVAFKLMPDQWLVAASHEGICEPSLIVEYLDADDT